MVAEIVLHDPLEDRVQKLEEELAALKVAVMERLAEIADALDRNGPIQRRINALKATLDSLRDETTAINASLTNQQRSIELLQTSINEIRNSVNAL